MCCINGTFKAQDFVKRRNIWSENLNYAKGVAIEGCTDEKGNLRFSKRHLEYVMPVLYHTKAENQLKVIEALNEFPVLETLHERMLSSILKTEVKRYFEEESEEGKAILKELGIEGVDEYFAGPTAVAYSDEVVSPAKVIAKFADAYEPLEIKGGIIEGKVASKEEIITLSKVPDKETLYSQVVYGLLFPFTKLAMLVKAVAEKAQEEGGEVAAAPAEEAAAPAEEAPAAEAEPVTAEAPAEA